MNKETLHRHARHGKEVLRTQARGAKSWWHTNGKLFLLAAGSFFILLISAFLIWVAFLKVPTINSFNERKVASSTKIYDRTGTVVLYDVNAGVRRTVVTSDKIDPDIKNAIVAIEDKDFYHHHGIQLTAIIRAIASQMLPFVKNSGGSTITQQLVKNTLLTQERSVSRKVKEWVLAIKIERVMTKDQILTAYLNEAPYGGSLYGVEEAARAFFGKSASDVDLAEAAYLAAIPNLPTYYSPYGKNRSNLNARKNLVLREMMNQGKISESEYAQAKNEEVTFRPREESQGKAIHFVEWIREYLENKYGKDAVLSGGLSVITTIDADIQSAAEIAIHDNAIKNEEAWGASNSALVAVDPKTGQILAMVGSRGYSDREIDGAFNVATAGRQPGSSFKPIVYARAFEKGFQPESIVFDIPTQFGPCDAFDYSMEPPCYAPGNYDNKFLGPLSLRNALAQSRNVPAVQLLSMVGLPDALAFAKKLGISTLDRTGDRYGLTLVLGGGEATLLDMTNAYATFANDGVHNPSTGILKVTDMQGNVLEEYQPQPETVVDYNAVRKLSSVLSDNVARAPLLGSNSFMYFGANRPVAAKTGTTSDNKDAWVIGYTPSVAIGVWSGNNDNTPMKKGSAISGPAWRAVMDVALRKLPYDNPGAAESFPTAEPDPDYDTIAPVLRGAWAGGESFWVDTISGKLATDLTPRETKKEIVTPNPHSILYWVDTDNIKGPRPANPASNSQYSRWEAEFQSWIANHPGLVPAAQSKPFGYDDVHTESNRPVVSFVNPSPMQSYPKESQVPIMISVQSHYPIKQIDYYLNDRFIGTTTNPSGYTFIPSDVDATPGNNTLKAVVTDTIYNRGEAIMNLEVE